MSEKHNKIILAALLHDINKVFINTSYEDLINSLNIEDSELANGIKCHHEKDFKEVELKADSIAYIIYAADRIATAANRGIIESGNMGFKPLKTIFNTLNENNQNKVYNPETISDGNAINYPLDKCTDDIAIKLDSIKLNLQNKIGTISYEREYLNYLLETFEIYLSHFPSSYLNEERADISLYDHIKITTAISSCIYRYLEEKGIEDYKFELINSIGDFEEKDIFRLQSMDLSGIQQFIYKQYDTKDALKNLRARSFYLEILLENFIDEILTDLELSRANLLYSGGGHVYLLLPNTEHAKDYLRTIEKKMNEWLCETFDIDLYLAMGYEACSPLDLQNKPAGSYKQMFINVSQTLSGKKRKRYSYEQIKTLNNRAVKDDTRECRICHRSDRVDSDGVCRVCNGLIRLSKGILDKDVLCITGKETETSMKIFENEYLSAATDEEANKLKNDDVLIRRFSKNLRSSKSFSSGKLWIGDYSSEKTLGELIEKGKGIKRLGVLRADVDNLGQAFVGGFSEDRQTISRSAAFSRKLSLFFKYHINHILENGEYFITAKRNGKAREASIIYSGGDDLFIVGAWKDIIEFSVDLHRAIKKYTQGKLTISAGIGIYPDKYPISYIADEVGSLEDCSKNVDGKNAVTLFDREFAFGWDDFIDKVLEEKFKLISDFFETTTERGKNFLYNILELLKNKSEKINLARLAYTLARMEPKSDAKEEEKQLYGKFSKKLYEWMQNDEDNRQLIMAIYIYAYLVRGEEE